MLAFYVIVFPSARMLAHLIVVTMVKTEVLLFRMPADPNSALFFSFATSFRLPQNRRVILSRCSYSEDGSLALS